MGRRRGFFAELQHQSRLADQRQAAAQRAHAAAFRRAEAAYRAAERAENAASKASEADRKRLEREAAQAHTDALLAETEQLNAELLDRYQQLDSILTATLEVDDYVDLEELRVTAEHPPFAHDLLRVPIPPLSAIPEPALPVQQAPAPVKGLFNRKEQLIANVTAVELQYAADYKVWQEATAALPARREEQAATYAQLEKEREAKLEIALKQYEAESAARDEEAAEQNAALDELIAGLAYGTVEAVQEYVGIVLANSVYPEWFDISPVAEFDASAGELAIKVSVPAPEVIPTIKGFRHVKASDEIVEQPGTQKDAKERYAAIVNNVALRTVHEVFEADRRGVIKVVALELETNATNPATGREISVPLVAVVATREVFGEIDLANATPAAALAHLGAVVSKNPSGLVPISSSGVRRV